MLFSFIFRFHLLLPEPVSILKAGFREGTRTYSCPCRYNYGGVFITQYPFNFHIGLYIDLIYHILLNRKTFYFAHQVFFFFLKYFLPKHDVMNNTKKYLALPGWNTFSDRILEEGLLNTLSVKIFCSQKGLSRAPGMFL